jgi:hypothetical protein
MKHYLLSIEQPDGPPPPSVDMDKVVRDVAALEQDMKVAGVWVFNAHLHPPSTATVLRVKDDDVLMTDGPFTEGKEHLGGISIIKASDLDSAIEWGGRVARATRLPVEVRPFYGEIEG